MQCEVCQGERTTPYAAKDGYDFHQCLDCGYVFCHPLPTAGDLAAIYQTGGEEGNISADHYPKASSRRRRGFFNALKFRRYVRGKRALDLGCGGGFVADGFRLVGSEAHGIDISADAIAYAEGHFPKCEFHLGTADAPEAGLGTFDFVYSSEVIEHVHDLEGYMQSLSALLNPGGAVFITTPDIGWSGRPEDPTKWDVFTPPIHVRFFSQASLSRLFERHGFKVIRRVPDRKAGLKMLFRKG